MLSSLPPELLRLVVEATVPHTFHSTTYRKRQANLLSLSLVSRRFREIAQPILIEIVWIWKRDQAERLRFAANASESLSQKVRWAVVGYEDMDDVDLDGPTIEGLLGILPSMGYLQVSSGYAPGIDVTKLEGLAHLSHLQLSCNTVTGSRAPCLPTIRSLTLIPQLKTLYFDLEAWHSTAAKFLHPFSAKTLVDFCYDDLEKALEKPSSVVNAHLSNVDLEEPEGRSTVFTVSKLRHFVNCLATQPPSVPLRRLYLDLPFRPTCHLPGLLRSELERLVVEAEARKIEVIYEPKPRDLSADPYISSDFSRRHRARPEKDR